MDKQFIKDLATVLAIVVIGGFVIGTLAHIFQIGQPSYVVNASHPCVITPVNVQPEPPTPPKP
jgi:nitric oxide reductase large subunit